MNEFTELALPLVKSKIGIRTDIRDSYISTIIKGVIDELQNTKGITLDITKFNHLMLVVDIAEWRYSNSKENGGALPINLNYRIKELYLKSHTGVANE